MSIRTATHRDIFQHCDRLAQRGHRLRPEQPPIAAFDADGTMWGPDVAELLWRRLLSERALHHRAAAPIARALKTCSGAEPTRDPYVDYPKLETLYRDGRCPEETMVRVMLEGLAGMREEDLYLHASEAVSASSELKGLDPFGTDEMIETMRGMGFRVIVVSGSPRWIVEVAVRPLGIEPADILAGQVAVVEGALTGGIIEPLPYGKGKIQAILRRYGAVPRVSVGNSLGDLAMMEATSDLRILVNPSDEMLLACERIKGPIWSTQASARATTQAAAVAQAGGRPAIKPSRQAASRS